LIVENANISYKELEILKSDYSSFNGRNFLSDFTAMVFNYINYATDVDHAYNKFLDNTTSLVEKMYLLRDVLKKK